MRPYIRLSLAAALVAAVASPSALAAQLPAQDPTLSSTGTRPIRFGLGGGVVVPREGATMRTLKSGAHAQGFLVFQLPAGLPALRANVDFARMRLEPARPATPSAGRPGTAVPTEETVRSMLAGVASLKFDLLRGPVRPYVLAGVGAFRLSDEAQAGLTDQTRSQLDFGVEGGAGLSIRLGPIDAFAETRLQNVYTKQKGLVDQKSIRAFPVTFGLTI
jgi:opacity protein-like surface antigen